MVSSSNEQLDNDVSQPTLELVDSEEMPALASIGTGSESYMHATVSVPLTIAQDAAITAANPWNQLKYHTFGITFGCIRLFYSSKSVQPGFTHVNGEQRE